MAKYSDGMIAVMVTFLICNGLAVGARVYSRVRITRSFGADDAMLCLTYVSRIAFSQLANLCKLSSTDKS